MNDAYVNVFKSVVEQTQTQGGVDLPEDVSCYIVFLLANFMDRPDIITERSFTHAYLKLSNPGGHSAKELGDACLFITGVFPTYGERHGIEKQYYQNMGISSYDMLSQGFNQQLFKTLSTHFVFLSAFIESVTNNSQPNLLFKKHK